MNKYLVFITLYFFSCNINIDENQKETSLDPPNINQYESNEIKTLYGINLDSFTYESNKIKWGDSFSGILSKNKINKKNIYEATQLSKEVFNLRKIKKGNAYTLFFKKEDKSLSHLVYESSKYDYLIWSFDSLVNFNKIEKKVSYRERQISGIINSSLYLSFIEKKYPIDLVNLIVDVFAWQIDFFRINPGDSYNIIYTEEIINGEYVGVRGIKAAKFTHNNNPFFAIGYDQGLGIDFFDENGKSLRKAFLRAPLNFYRISSKFKKGRFHPVLKRYRDHLGTDYAAPRGTPIYTVADGKVVEARYARNNGYYVKIAHNNIFTTQYLHMSKFAAGIKNGKIVKQGDVIGYVGSTGLATGPHVCFRFWRNGKQVDPYKQNDLPEGDPILSKHEESFNYLKEKYLKLIEG